MSDGLLRAALVGLAALAAILWLPASAAAADYAQLGPYPVGYRDVTISLEGQAPIAARYYYPALEGGGLGAPVDRREAPWPGIAFGHGRQSPVTNYHTLLRHWASWGLIVVAPATQTQASPDHDRFAEDLRASLTWMTTLGRRRRGQTFPLVDAGALGLGGHSMGGGVATLAAARDARVRALSTLAAAETTPSAVAAIANVTAPVQLLAATGDTVTPPEETQIPMYEAAGGPRQLVLFTGGTHTGFRATSGWQAEYTWRYTTAWWLLELGGRQDLWQAVWAPSAERRVTFTAEP